MKTITKTIRVPQLVIKYDEDASSPREWDNLGYFITCDSKHYSPDKNETLKNIISETSEESANQKEHMKLIKRRIKKDMHEKVLAIYPIVKYEHSGVSYSLGTIKGFDYSNNGFYIITDKTAEDRGGISLKGTKAQLKKYYESIIKSELEEYNNWANGNVYRFELYNEAGEVEDSVGGFYDIDDIKGHLPKSWANEELSAYMAC